MFQDFQEAIIIVAANPILWIGAFATAAMIALSVLEPVLYFVRRWKESKGKGGEANVH